MMTIRKRRFIFITIIILVILIALMVVFVLLNKSNTKIFKSDKANIEGNIEQISNNIFSILNMGYDDEIYEDLYDKKYKSNMEVIYNNSKKVGKWKYINESEVSNLENYKYNHIDLSYDDKNIAEIELYNKDELYGIRFTKLFLEFVSVKNKEFSELVDKIEGIDLNGLKNINDLEDLNIFEKIKFTKNEKENLKKKYIDIVNRFFQEYDCTVQNNATLSYNNTTVNTAKSYMIKLNKSDIKKLYIEILNNLKEEDILLSKIIDLNSFINLFSKSGEDDLIQDYTDYINQIVQGLEQDENEYEIRITLYELNDKVIKINVVSNMQRFDIEFQDDSKIVINNIEYSENDEVKTNIELQNKLNKEDNLLQNELDIIFERNNTKKIIYIKHDINILDELKEKIDVNKDNIILNDLSNKNINIIINKIIQDVGLDIQNKISIIQSGIDIDLFNNLSDNNNIEKNEINENIIDANDIEVNNIEE